MRCLALSLLCLALAAGPALAKPKGCFSGKEEVAEQVVRHGIRLREGAWRCEELGFAAQTMADWRVLDAQLAEQFAAQVAVRSKAFEREFEGQAQQQLRLWDGRIVGYFRHRPLTESYCRRLTDMLSEPRSRGWPNFKKQALAERSEVRIDYKICR